MKMLLRTLFWTAAVFQTAIGHEQISAKPEDTADVRHVLDASHSAIHPHDGNRLARCFFQRRSGLMF